MNQSWPCVLLHLVGGNAELLEQLHGPVPVLGLLLRELGHAHLLFRSGRLAHPLRIHVRGEELRAGLIREQTHAAPCDSAGVISLSACTLATAKLALYHATVLLARDLGA